MALSTQNAPIVNSGPDGERPDPAGVSEGNFFKPEGIPRIDILERVDGVSSWVSIPTGVVGTAQGVSPITINGDNAPHDSSEGLVYALTPLANPLFYVDPVTGNDNNTGTIGSPFLTINHALKALIPGWYGLATLNLRAGTHTISNKTVVPRGLGNTGATAGGLLINGVDNTDSGLGPRTASGGTTGSQATFGTVVDSVGGLTANAHRGKFIRFTSGATLNNRAYLIEDNTTTTFTIEGSITAAPTTETFVVETPAAVISWVGSQAIMGFGSILGLQNVVLNGPGGSSSLSVNETILGLQKIHLTNLGSSGIILGEHSSIINLSSLAAQLGTTTITQQCGSWFNFNAAISIVSTGRMSVSRSLFDSVRCEMFQMGMFQGIDCTFRGNAYIRSVFNGDVSLDRFRFIAVNPSALNNSLLGAYGAAIVLSKGSTGSIIHGDISNTPATAGPGDAVLVEDRSSAQISVMTGTGNAGVGTRVARFSEVVEDKSAASLTLTGTLGDIKVGQNAISAWPTSATQTDLVELCAVIGL